MAAQNATLEALLPQLLALIRGQQYDYLMKNPNAASQFGMEKPANSVPLNDAIVKMAYGMLPGWAQGGLQSGGSVGGVAGGGVVGGGGGGGYTQNPDYQVTGGRGGRGGQGGQSLGEETPSDPGLNGTFPWDTHVNYAPSPQGRGGRSGQDSGQDLGQGVFTDGRSANQPAWWEDLLPLPVRLIMRALRGGKDE